MKGQGAPGGRLRRVARRAAYGLAAVLAGGVALAVLLLVQVASVPVTRTSAEVAAGDVATLPGGGGDTQDAVEERLPKRYKFFFTFYDI